MTVWTIQQGDHRLLLNDLENVAQMGRTAAERTMRELRRHGFHPYPLRFAPTIYNIGLAESQLKAAALRDLFDIQRAAIRRILNHRADPEGREHGDDADNREDSASDAPVHRMRRAVEALDDGGYAAAPGRIMVVPHAPFEML